MCNLRQYRHAAGMSADELGQLVGLSGDAVLKMENGRRNLLPDYIPSLSKALESPEMVLDYCRTCPIGQKYGFERLNNVDLHPLSVARSMKEEIGEVVDSLEAVEDIQSRRGPFSALYEGQIKQAERAADEVIDVLHNGWILLEVLAREMGVDPEDAFKRHNDKLYQRGYVQTKAPADARAV